MYLNYFVKLCLASTMWICVYQLIKVFSMVLDDWLGVCVCVCVVLSWYVCCCDWQCVALFWFQASNRAKFFLHLISDVRSCSLTMMSTIATTWNVYTYAVLAATRKLEKLRNLASFSCTFTLKSIQWCTYSIIIVLIASIIISISYCFTKEASFSLWLFVVRASPLGTMHRAVFTDSYCDVPSSAVQHSVLLTGTCSSLMSSMGTSTPCSVTM